MNDLSESDLTALSNALNEVLNGPDAITDASEFHTRIGLTPDEARQLLQRLSQ